MEWAHEEYVEDPFSEHSTPPPRNQRMSRTTKPNVRPHELRGKKQTYRMGYTAMLYLYKNKGVASVKTRPKT